MSENKKEKFGGPGIGWPPPPPPGGPCLPPFDPPPFPPPPGGGWWPFCFVAGTKVTMGDGTEKNIEDIGIGDEVKSWNEETKELGVSKVINLKRPMHNDMVILEWEHATLINTFDHPHYSVVKNGWVSYKPELTLTRYDFDTIKQLEVANPNNPIGDIGLFLSEEGVLVESKLLSIKEDIGDVQTYIFELDTNNTFFANGILTHNKPGPEPTPEPNPPPKRRGGPVGRRQYRHGGFYHGARGRGIHQAPGYINNPLYSATPNIGPDSPCPPGCEPDGSGGCNCWGPDGPDMRRGGRVRRRRYHSGGRAGHSHPGTPARWSRPGNVHEICPDNDRGYSKIDGQGWNKPHEQSMGRATGLPGTGGQSTKFWPFPQPPEYPVPRPKPTPSPLRRGGSARRGGVRRRRR